jgi:hypothetical protein
VAGADVSGKPCRVGWDAASAAAKRAIDIAPSHWRQTVLTRLYDWPFERRTCRRAAIVATLIAVGMPFVACLLPAAPDSWLLLTTFYFDLHGMP